ncbi:MAG: amidohydrolase family protein [Myxococcota bacterium]
MRIDGHGHACGEYLNLGSIKSQLDTYGFDCVVLCPGQLNNPKSYPLPELARFLPSVNLIKYSNLLTKGVVKFFQVEEDLSVGNQYVWELASQSRGRVIQFFWLTRKMVATQITNKSENLVFSYLARQYENYGFAGIKLHQCWEKFTVKSEYFKSVAKWAISKKLPLFIHLSSRKEVLKLLELKTKMPDLKLIIAHLFGFDLAIKKGLPPGTFFDISTYQLVSDKKLLKAMKELGPEKLIFGTDTPYGKNNLGGNLNRLSRLGLDHKAKKLILGKNMEKLIF